MFELRKEVLNLLFLIAKETKLLNFMDWLESQLEKLDKRRRK